MSNKKIEKFSKKIFLENFSKDVNLQPADNQGWNLCFWKTLLDNQEV